MLAGPGRNGRNGKFVALAAAAVFLLGLCGLAHAQGAAQSAAQSAVEDEYVSLPTRPGVSVPLAVTAPEHPRGVVVLLAGSKGLVGITDDGGHAALRNGGNFLVRSRALFAAQGLVAIVVDTPSDQPEGMSASFRLSPQHVDDLRRVAAYARQRFGLAPWLVGTSMGTFSAAHATVNIPPDELGGVALTSTITHGASRWALPAGYGNGVLGVDLAAIRVPALVARHQNDGCAFSPPEGGTRVLNALTAAPRKTLLTFAGGDAARSKACEAFAPHGYLGVEEQAVAGMAAFILEGAK